MCQCANIPHNIPHKIYLQCANIPHNIPHHTPHNAPHNIPTMCQYSCTVPMCQYTSQYTPQYTYNVPIYLQCANVPTYLTIYLQYTSQHNSQHTPQYTCNVPIYLHCANVPIYLTIYLQYTLQYTSQHTPQYTCNVPVCQYTSQYTHYNTQYTSNIPYNIPHNIPHNIPAMCQCFRRDSKEGVVDGRGAAICRTCSSSSLSSLYTLHEHTSVNNLIFVRRCICHCHRNKVSSCLLCAKYFYAQGVHSIRSMLRATCLLFLLCEFVR